MSRVVPHTLDSSFRWNDIVSGFHFVRRSYLFCLFRLLLVCFVFRILLALTI